MRPPSVLIGLAAAPLALMAGCGSQQGAAGGPGDGDPSTDASAASWQGCTPQAFDAAGPTVLTLDDGTAVKLPTDGPCAGGLVVRADGGVAGTDVRDLGLVADTAAVLDAGQAAGGAVLRIDGGVHPRGGFQPHVYVVGDGSVDEVTADGRPVVPFVATDGGMAPLAVRCGDGSLEVLTATTSEPPGVVLAWDVRGTTYQLGPDGARRTGTTVVAKDAADPVLHRDMPELFDPGRLFAGC